MSIDFVTNIYAFLALSASIPATAWYALKAAK